MKGRISNLLFVVTVFGTYAQQSIQGILLDSVTKTPLVYATIYNSKDNTITNEEGRFVFYSKIDSVKIKMLGYKAINTTFKNLQKSDTILLAQKPFLLDEVEILNGKQILDKAWKNRFKNYPSSYHKEKFYLRSVLKRNNEIESLADFYGKVAKNTTFTSREKGIKKIKYKLELLNLRKARLYQKKWLNSLGFSFPDFRELFTAFSRIFVDSNKINIKTTRLSEENLIKLSYTTKQEFKSKHPFVGYLIIDTDDYSIKEFYIKSAPEFNIEYQRVLFGLVKYRQAKYKSFIKLNKNEKTGLHYINNGFISTTVEVFLRKKHSVLEHTFNYINIESFVNEDIQPNISVKKDVFKIDYPYDANFWKTQNQLPLTKELKTFLKNIEKPKKGYKTVNNFKEK